MKRTILTLAFPLMAQMAALIPAMQTGFIGNRAENGKHAADNQQKILKKEKGKPQ